MTVTLNPYLLSDTARGQEPLGKHPSNSLDRMDRTLTIGLVNNMADAALEATERQFSTLLNAASDGYSVRLLFFTLPGISRSEAGARRIQSQYSSTELLPDANLDGLIVTGREPLSANLADEPYWQSFARVVDWARENAVPTIWSCLAAHAAVQYMDGILRVRNSKKQCGLLECVRISDHALMEGAPRRFRIPHSRWNGLPENELVDCGYNVLTRTANAGVDAFCKYDDGVFLFFQGHPEYEAATLLLEYRRDVGRYLRRESANYPSIPRGCFNRKTTTVLAAFRRRALSDRSENAFQELSEMLGQVNMAHSWSATASLLYRNWLDLLSARKEKNLQSESEISSRELPGSGSALPTERVELVAG